MRWYVLVMAIWFAETTEARMYEWVNPKTGIWQLSGAPPSWYRSPGGGARIRVYEQGNLIDDTSFPVSEERREALRQQAFKAFEERK